jgi:hypothetical protein
MRTNVREGNVAGPDSIPSRVLDRRSLLRGYGGRGDLEEDEPLLGSYFAFIKLGVLILTTYSRHR